MDYRGKKPREVQSGSTGGYGGSGALKGWDGWPYLCTPAGGGGLMIPNVEIVEYQTPTIIRERKIWTDGAGDGQWRGGWGMQSLSQPILSERSGRVGEGGHVRGQAFGAIGGTAAPPNFQAKVKLASRAGIDIQLPLLTQVTIHEDEAMLMGYPGGGGWGNPVDRDPELVRKDARNGIISIKKANKIYGVVLDTDTEFFDVDYQATKELRETIKKQHSQPLTISAITSDEL
jgi:N-methylhydantoinase B